MCQLFAARENRILGIIEQDSNTSKGSKLRHYFKMRSRIGEIKIAAPGRIAPTIFEAILFHLMWQFHRNLLGESAHAASLRCVSL